MAAPVARSVTTALSIDARGWVAGGQVAQRSMRETSRVAQQGAREAIRAFREQQAAQERAAAAAEKASQRAAREQTRASQQVAREAQKAARVQEAATKRAAAEAERAAEKQRQAYTSVGTAVGAAGLAITAGLGYAIGKSMDFEAAMSGAAAATGLSGKALEALQETAIRAGASTQYSATEAADAITVMAKAGIAASDIMGGGLTGALNLAAAGQLAVADAAEIAATAMTQFHLKGADLPHVADLLAAGAGKAQGSVQDLGLALSYVGPVAAGMGISIEETTGAIAELSAQGIIGEKAGTGLRGVLSTLSAPSEKAAGVMEDLGISLYDANGHFIGVRGAAQELHRTLGPLDEATRNQALGQIFGNEQLVAARVLYQGGGQAVDDWTAKVNDAGFAAEQAAKLTDNLRGDLERLGGAFDTALIGSGSSANGVLREMVQLGTGVLDIYNSLPGPVQTAGTAFAAVSGGVGLLAGGLLLAAPRIQATKTALADMGRVGTVLQRGLSGTAGVLGGPWGIALAAGTVALGFWAQRHAEAVKRQQDLRGTLDQTTGAITQQTTAMVAQRLQSEGTFELFGNIAGGVENLTQAAMGNAGAMDAIRDRQAAAREEMQRLYDLGRVMTPQEQARAEGLAQMDTAYGELYKRLGGVRSELGEQITAQREVAAATGATTDATGAAAGATRGMTSAVSAQAREAQETKDRIDDLTSALKAIYDANFGAEEAADAFRSALNDLDKSAAKGTRSIKGNSAAALTNREALRRVAQAALNATEKYAEQGHTTDEVRVKAGKYRAELIRSARQAGFSQTAAEHYADALLQVPKDVKTNVRTPGMTEAAAKIKAIQELIDKLNSSDVDVAVRVGTTNRLAAQTRAGADRRAAGGYISGPGGPTDDLIPAYLSNGEYVQRAAAVQKYGPRFMDAVNSGAFPRELAQAFAAGGRVGPNVTIRGMTDLSSQMATLVKANAAAEASVAGGAGGMNVPIPGGVGQAGLMALARWFQGLGARVSEHPRFGGVHPVHVPGSDHYRGRAIDVNFGAGTSAREQAFFDRVVGSVRAKGFKVLWRVPGHFNHLHAAYANGGPVSRSRVAPAATYRGGFPSARRYATGGPVLGGDYSGISSIVSARVTVSRDDVTSSRNDVTAANKKVQESAADLAKANKELAKANRELAHAKKDERKSAREAVERAREDRNDAAKALREDRAAASKARTTAAQTARDYRTQTRPLSARFHEAAGTRNRITAGFLRNLQTLASRGFGDLARQLSEMGGSEAETLAAQAVASTRTARTLQADLTTSARLQAQAATLPAQLAITSALRTQRNPTIAGLSKSTGLATSDLQAAALSMRGSLGRNANARALLSGLGTNTTAGGFAPVAGGDTIVVQVASTGNPWLDGERALAGAKRVKSVGSSRRF